MASNFCSNSLMKVKFLILTLCPLFIIGEALITRYLSFNSNPQMRKLGFKSGYFRICKAVYLYGSLSIIWELISNFGELNEYLSFLDPHR